MRFNPQHCFVSVPVQEVEKLASLLGVDKFTLGCRIARSSSRITSASEEYWEYVGVPLVVIKSIFSKINLLIRRVKIFVPGWMRCLLFKMFRFMLKIKCDEWHRCDLLLQFEKKNRYFLK